MEHSVTIVNIRFCVKQVNQKFALLNESSQGHSLFVSETTISLSNHHRWIILMGAAKVSGT
jgi:hypothetical protein